MATIYAAATDSQVTSAQSGGGDEWDRARHNNNGVDATPTVNSTHTLHNMLYTRKYSATHYTIIRSFLTFDTSGISVAPSEATLKINGSGATVQVIIVKVNAGATINLDDAAVAGDWDQLTGYSAGNTMDGNVTEYSSAVTSISAGYNDFALNSDALSDMASLGVLKLAVIEYQYDYSNTPTPATHPTGTRQFYAYFTDQSGIDKDPYIDYTAGVASGFGHKTGPVASANISKINGVATANIGKVLGVD